MQKLVSFVLAVMLAFGLVGCSSSGGDAATENDRSGESQGTEQNTTVSFGAISDDVLPVAQEYYSCVKQYMDGTAGFNDTKTRLMEISETGGQELQDIGGVIGIELFFMLGEDNPNDALLAAAVNVLGITLYPDEYTSSSNGTNTSEEVTHDEEITLRMIAEDIAKQIAQNPQTVNFKTLYWGFAKNGDTYAVQGTFECSNLMGVKEEHDLQVWCTASRDRTKIQPPLVFLDGVQISE